MKKSLYILVPLLFAAMMNLAFHVLAPDIAQTIAFKAYPPEQQASIRAEYRAWLSNPIHLPPEALEAPPFTTQTLTEVKNFDKAWEKYGKAAMKFTRPYQDGKAKYDAATVKPALQEFSPLCDAFNAVIEQPDYELTILASMNHRILGVIPLIDGMAFMTGKELLRLKAQVAASEQHWPEAFQTVEKMAHATHTHPYAFFIVQMMSLVVRAQAIDLWSEFINQCNDTVLLRRALNAQNALAEQMQYFGESAVPMMSVATISEIREFMRAGFTLEFQDKTGRELSLLELESHVRLWETAYANEMKTSPTQAALRKQNILSSRQMAGIIKRSSFTLPFIFKSIRPEFSHLRTEPLACRQKLNQLRLQTARKLYRLEHGVDPVNDTELSPGYLPSPLTMAEPIVKKIETTVAK